MVLMALIGVLGWYYLQRQQEEAYNTVENELSTIADLKAARISNWMMERRGDGEVALYKMQARQYLAEPTNNTVRTNLLQWMAACEHAYGYKGVALFDSHGALVLASPEDKLFQNTNIFAEVQAGLHAKGVIVSDLHRDQPGLPIHMTMLVPMGIKAEADKPADSALLFDIDPYRFLYPLVQSWPTPSRTAESLLVRKDGNDVLYLNELRHRTNTALILRLPIDTNSNLPAANAVKGQEGIMEGRDYRGVPVLSAARKIPDTDWFLVAKVDQAEIYAPIRHEDIIVGLLVGALMVATFLMSGIVWHKYKLGYARRELAQRSTHLQEVERLNRIYATLSQINQSMVHVKTREELFQQVCDVTVKYGGFKLAWIGWQDADSQKVNPVGRAGDSVGYLDKVRVYADNRPEGHGSVGMAIRDGHSCIINDFLNAPETAPWHEAAREYELRAGAAFPIRFQGKTCGVLAVYSVETGVFQDKEVALLEEAAMDISYVLDQLALEEKRKQAELALENERNLIRTIIDQIPDSIYARDADNRFVLANKSVALRMGASTPDELIGKTDADFYPPDQAKRLATADSVIYKGHSLINVEEEIKTRDGLRRVLLTSKVPFRDTEGKVTLLVGTGRDITNYKRMEEALRHSEDKFAAAFAQNPAAIVMTHLDDGKFIEVNDTWVRLYGYSRDEVIGKTFGELSVWPKAETRELFIEALKKDGKVQGWEEKLRKKSGEIFLGQISAQLLRVGGEELILTTVLDITEHKRAEEERAHLFHAIQQAAETIVITDVLGNITYANPSFEKTSGYKLEEVVGKNPRILKSGKQNEAYYKHMWETLSRGEVWHGHFINKRKDGTLYKEDATISPVRDASGRVVNYIALKLDVTREADLEAQLRQSQKMEAIGRLAGGIAHDFNNILAGIQIQTDLMKIDENLPVGQREYVGEIGTAVKRAAALTRQLLLYGRKQVMQPQDMELNEVINKMTQMLRRVLGEDIELQFKFAPQALYIHADPSMMDQVLMNLAINSRDAMPQGGRLVIETTVVEVDKMAAAQFRRARPGSFIRLNISDTGSGIPPENLERIFEPFFTTKPSGKGTGLGLAVVHGIVEQHQGWINVYSDGMHGTTFHIYLPQIKKVTMQKPEQSVAQPIPRGKETILFVEDDPFLFASLRQTLAHFGYRVFIATNGKDAIEIWKQHGDEIQLLLTDLVMPGGVSGKDLAEQLLKDNPKLKVIYTSGYSAEIVGKDFPLLEGVNFLSKPFQAAQLARTLRIQLDA